jgi:hypothetical protein
MCSSAAELTRRLRAAPPQVPAQLALAVSHLFWCRAVEACFAADDPVAALQGQLETNVAQLAALTALVRGQLSPLERKVGR